MRLEWEGPGVVRLTAEAHQLDRLLSAAQLAAAAAETSDADRQDLAHLVTQLREAGRALDTPPPEGLFHAGSRELQDRYGTRRLADRIDDKLVGDVIGENDKEFIERADMFFLATADGQGRPNCSYKGGDPGFVRVLDEHTLAFGNYDGNGMFLSTGNILRNPAVGLLFIDFERGHRTRVNGSATLDTSPELVAAWPEAQFVVRVRVRELFPNCPRYIHRYQLVRRSSFVPRVDAATPVPAWKRADWAVDVLPPGDPANDPGRELLDR